jgi:hypothetical protein
MATPVKNFTQPTAMSTVKIGTSFPMLFHPDRIKTFKQNLIMMSSPMFYNQLGTKFAFANLYLTPLEVDNFWSTIPKDGLYSQPPLYMLANTFPAAYTKTVIRPTYGQIWPRSGFLPPF